MPPVSSAVINPANLELTPVRVTYKGVDLGATLGNATLSLEVEKGELKADQLGSTVIDRRISGHKMTVSTELAEIRLKDNWKVVFPWLNLVTSGPNKALFANSQIGRSDQSDAGALILHPLSLADADKAGDYNFYKAICEGKAELVYGPGEQVKLKATFNILPDFTVTPARFALIGDPAIGLISASAGSPVFVGTGNGAMGSVVVYNGFTKTETITAVLVTTALDGGIFHVSGSVSGSLGLATVGVPFVSPVISFTIADGTTDFVLADSFTVATVAANYV